jgi:RNA polymerase sigma factor (sigma-70 family)
MLSWTGLSDAAPLPDAQLRPDSDYAEHGHEAAFREIVTRHTDVVYSSALRQVGSPEQARDVAQCVFGDLARKAKPLASELAGNASLLGWLYRSTRFAALRLMRDERRRHARERQVMEHFNPASEESPHWDRVSPVLDEAMADLNDEDREALLLRFFKNHDFRAVGTALGVSDDTAQKRVSRALERLRAHITRRGVTTTAVALTTALSANAITVAPAGLVATLSSTALAGIGTIATVTATSAKTIAMTTLQKTLITAAAVSFATFAVLQHQSQSSLRKENQSLRQQVEQLSPLAAENQRLARQLADAQPVFPPFPPAPALPETTAPPDEQPTNHLSRLLNGDQVLRLTSTQAEEFLKENRRTAASLLAAYRTSGDKTFLAEAMQRYPTNVHVAFEAAFKADATPEERRHWLDVFQQAAPDNPLSDYLSALTGIPTIQWDGVTLIAIMADIILHLPLDLEATGVVMDTATVDTTMGIITDTTMDITEPEAVFTTIMRLPEEGRRI